jgi:hypothetical protein
VKDVRSTAAAVLFIVVAINVAAFLWGLPLLILNTACALAFVFFTCAVSPESPLGFALTLRDWGDIYRRGVLRIGAFTADQFRRAAAKSLAIWSTVLALCVLLEFSRRDATAHAFLQSIAALAGVQAGFVFGYLFVVRRGR